MTHSLSSTSRSGTIGLVAKEPYPHLPYASHSELPDVADTRQPPVTVVVRSRKSRFEGLANAYTGISWIFGFKEKYSLALCGCNAFQKYVLQLIFTIYSDIFWWCSHRLLPCPQYNDEPSKCT